MSHSTIEKLYQHIKRYCLHEALAFIGDVGAEIIKRKNPEIINLYPQFINEWQLAFLAKALIINSNDYRRKAFTKKELLICANIYNNLEDKFLKVSQDNDEEFQKAGQSFLIRTAYQQFSFQRGINYLISRALFLFEEIPNTINNPSFEMEKEIRSIYSLSAREVIIIGFIIFATIKKGYFEPDYLLNFNDDNFRKFITKETLGKLVDKLSANYKKIREVFFNYDETDKELEQFSFNALRIFPIVKTDIAGLVVPVPRFLLERITTGIYYSLMDKYKDYNSNKFMEFFGKEIFERYVGLLLQQKYKINESLFKEWQYKKGKNKCLTSDWIIIQNNIAILIECKTSGISLEAKSWAELEKIQYDLKLRVVKAIEQMVDLVNNVRGNCRGLERLFSIKNFYYIVITYDKIFLSSSFIIRNMIKNELIKKDIVAPIYEILSIDELENLIPFLNDFSLEFLLDNKFKNNEWEKIDFDNYMYYFLTDNNLNTKRENELLKDKSDRFFKEINPRLKSVK